MMSFTAEDRELLESAFRFADEAHADNERKIGGAPYISHPLQVAGLVLEFGGSASQASAALLHDVVEDSGVTVAEIESRFGTSVASMVADLTDTLPGDSPDQKSPWRTRKLTYLRHLDTTGPATQLVAACDKVHNLTGIVDALRTDGPDALAAFNADVIDVLWFYGEVLERLDQDVPAGLRARYRSLLDTARRLLE